MSVPPDLQGRIESLADLLKGRGALTARWRKALETVPRHLFIPARAWASPLDDRDDFPIDRDADPDAWWDAVYSNTILVTQADDGASEAASGQGKATCSNSAPSAVFDILRHLDVEPPQWVLEIGTGTGWTAGLLAARAGAENVTTIEVDPGLAEVAQANLKAAGLAPRVVVADGADGFPGGAPFDRVHATCAVNTIPYTWVEQTRPGGIIVTPHDPGFGYGYLARLHVQPDGTAIGRFPSLVGFMMLRSQRHAAGPPSAFTMNEQGADASVTRTDPRQVVWDSYDADLAISALAPGVQYRVTEHDDGTATVYLLETASHDGAWARIEYQVGCPEFEVIQNGARRLWDEVEAAYFTWHSWGRPSRDRFGITVTPDGQHVWKDDPANVIKPETPRA